MKAKKRKINDTNDLPSWFKLDKYKCANTLDARGWAEQLIKRNLIIENHSEHLKEWEEIQNNPINDEFKICLTGMDRSVRSMSPYDLAQKITLLDEGKASYLIDARKQLIENEEVLESALLDPPDESEELISILNSTALDEWTYRPFVETHPLQEFLPVAVDMQLPDELIIEDFKIWLKNTREKIEPFQRTKRAIKQDFDLWVRSSVLQYIDLSIWGKIEGVSISSRIMAAAIFPFGEGGEDRIRKTTAPIANDLLSNGWIVLYSMALRSKKIIESEQ